jgi:hypothetical protein
MALGTGSIGFFNHIHFMVTNEVMALVTVKGYSEFLHVFCMGEFAPSPAVLIERMALEAKKRFLHLDDLYLFHFLFCLNLRNERSTAPPGKKKRY